MDRTILDATAELFAYPTDGAIESIQTACGVLEQLAPSMAEGARGLRDIIEKQGVGAAEEHFTRVFDVNPTRNLECGWHLYGEDYARGAFLVQMRTLLRAVDVEEGTELADYLPTLLRALARLPKGKGAIFSTNYLQPALTIIVKGFAGRETPYGDVLRGLLAAMETEFGPTSVEAAAPPAQATPYAGVSGCSPMSSPTEGGPNAW